MKNLLRAALVTIIINSIPAYAAGHKIKGEILPDLTKNNLLKDGNFANGIKSWKLINPARNTSVSKVTIDNFPAIKIIRKNDKGYSALVSTPCNVKSGQKYFTTALYSCLQAKFGTSAVITVVPAREVESYLQKIRRHTPYIAMGKREVLSRKKGSWVRRTGYYKVPKDVNKVCVLIIQYGSQSSITYSSIYFGKFPEKRFFDKAAYNSDIETAVKEPELSKIIEARPSATGSVVKYGDVPAFKIDGKIQPPLIYFGDAYLPRRSKLQDFQKAGVNLQILSLSRYRNFWKSKGKYDFKKVDRYLGEAIARNPKGNFIILIDVSPYQEWSDEYPDHIAIHPDGKPATGRHGRKAPPSYWSELYRKQAYEFVRAIVGHLRKQPYYKCVAGFFLSGNEDGQFYYNSIGKTLHNGQSPAAAKAFRNWLKERYGNIKALRKAWRQPNLEFANVKVPVTAKRIGGTFINPATQQAYIDFCRFLNESMASFANRLCRTAKDSAGKEVFTVMWWGRGGAQLVYPHFGQSKVVFPNNDMDVMGSQAGYYGERENGCTCFMPWIYDSARIHNKITMLEADFRTWLSPLKSMQHDYHVARYWNLYDLKGALLRDFGKQVAVGGGLWLYDMSSGWFKSPDIMKLVKNMYQAAEKLYSKPVKVTPAEIALVVDEQNFYRTTEQLDVWNGPNYHALRLSQRALQRSGLKYDFIFFNDILKGKRDNYKVYIFMNQWMISPEQREFIDSKLKRDGKTLVWLYAPGYLTRNGFSVKNMQQITGLKLEKNGRIVGSANFVNKPYPILKGVNGKTAGLGISLYGSRFVVQDKFAQTLARYEDGKSAIAVKIMNNWKSIYIGGPAALTPQFLNNMARYVGVHTYNTSGDMFVYHRDDLVCLHGVEGQTNHMQFPAKVKITDLFSGKTLLESGTKLQIKLKPGETRLLHITENK